MSEHQQVDPGHEDYTPPRPWLRSRGIVLALVVGMGWLAWAFGTDAVEHAQLVRRARAFVPVQAKIIHVGTHQEGKNYVPELRFEYTVGGARHVGTNRHEAQAYRDAALARQATEAYSNGQRVTVYVDPQQPRRAALHREVSWMWGLSRGLMALVFAIGVVFVLVMVRRADRKAAAMAYARHVRDRAG